MYLLPYDVTYRFVMLDHDIQGKWVSRYDYQQSGGITMGSVIVICWRVTHMPSQTKGAA